MWVISLDIIISLFREWLSNGVVRDHHVRTEQTLQRATASFHRVPRVMKYSPCPYLFLNQIYVRIACCWHCYCRCRCCYCISVCIKRLALGRSDTPQMHKHTHPKHTVHIFIRSQLVFPKRTRPSIWTVVVVAIATVFGRHKLVHLHSHSHQKPPANGFGFETDRAGGIFSKLTHKLTHTQHICSPTQIQIVFGAHIAHTNTGPHTFYLHYFARTLYTVVD